MQEDIDQAVAKGGWCVGDPCPIEIAASRRFKRVTVTRTRMYFTRSSASVCEVVALPPAAQNFVRQYDQHKADSRPGPITFQITTDPDS